MFKEADAFFPLDGDDSLDGAVRGVFFGFFGLLVFEVIVGKLDILEEFWLVLDPGGERE